MGEGGEELEINWLLLVFFLSFLSSIGAGKIYLMRERERERGGKEIGRGIQGGSRELEAYIITRVESREREGEIERNRKKEKGKYEERKKE